LVLLPALPRVPASTALAALAPEPAPALNATSVTDPTSLGPMLVTAGPEVPAPPFPVTGSLPPPALLTLGALPALEPPRLESDPQCNNAPLMIASNSPRRTVAFLGAIRTIDLIPSLSVSAPKGKVTMMLGVLRAYARHGSQSEYPNGRNEHCSLVQTE
jgi:hypothetical protein